MGQGEGWTNRCRDEAAEWEGGAWGLLEEHWMNQPDMRAIAFLLLAVCLRLEVIDVQLQIAQNPDEEPVFGEGGHIPTDAARFAMHRPKES